MQQHKQNGCFVRFRFIVAANKTYKGFVGQLEEFRSYGNKRTTLSGNQTSVIALLSFPICFLLKREAVWAPRGWTNIICIAPYLKSQRRRSFASRFSEAKTQCPIFCFPCRTCNRIATACLPWNTCCRLGLSGRSFSWSTIRIDTVFPTTRFMKANDTGVSTPRLIKVCKDILMNIKQYDGWSTSEQAAFLRQLSIL